MIWRLDPLKKYKLYFLDRFENYNINFKMKKIEVYITSEFLFAYSFKL